MQFIDDCCLDGRNPIQETALFSISSFPEWCFCSPANSSFLPYTTASDDLSLLLCCSVLLLWLPLIFASTFCPTLRICWMICILHLLVLCLSANGLILPYPSATLALDYPALFICSPTILYHGLPSAMPSACLILPCPIYACNILSRFILFSTSATYLHLSYATKLDC